MSNAKSVIYLWNTLFLLESVRELYTFLLVLAVKELSGKQSLDDWYKGKDDDSYYLRLGVWKLCIYNVVCFNTGR